MILQINEISENELQELVKDSSQDYYIGKSKDGLHSAIVRINKSNEKIISKLILLMSYKS